MNLTSKLPKSEAHLDLVSLAGELIKSRNMYSQAEGTGLEGFTSLGTNVDLSELLSSSGNFFSI